MATDILPPQFFISHIICHHTSKTNDFYVKDIHHHYAIAKASSSTSIHKHFQSSAQVLLSIFA